MAEVYFHCSSAQGLLRNCRSMRAVAAIEAPAIMLSGWLGGWSGEVYRIWRSVLQGIRDPYRPELHYMRGPGPKWRAKYGFSK
jgi:hypothetical protein